MKINCSGGLGVMEHQDCLAHALKLRGAQACGFDYVLLKAMFGSSQRDKRASEIHVTDLTGCIRKAWYDKLNPTPEYPHEALTRWLGTATHEAAEVNDDHVQSEVPVSHMGIIGTADIVYEDGRLVDTKTTRWLYPDKVPYSSHALQVNIYAYLLRKQGKKVKSLQIQYIDMSGPTKCRKCRMTVRYDPAAQEFACPQCGSVPKGSHLGAVLCEVPLFSDREVEEQFVRRLEDLKAAIESSMAPEREPGYLCGYCASLEVCRPDHYE